MQWAKVDDIEDEAEFWIKGDKEVKRGRGDNGGEGAEVVIWGETEGLCFHRGACNLQSALANRRRGESSSPLMQVAIQEELARPRREAVEGMRGGLTGTQVERDKGNQTETLRMVAPSRAPAVTLSFSPGTNAPREGDDQPAVFPLLSDQLIIPEGFCCCCLFL